MSLVKPHVKFFMPVKSTSSEGRLEGDIIPLKCIDNKQFSALATTRNFEKLLAHFIRGQKIGDRKIHGGNTGLRF